MELLNGILIGLATVAAAVCFPGMLNMTAVSVSLRAGRRAGYEFAAGLVATLMVQAGTAIFFADYLASHPGIIVGMKRWAILIFVGLAAFFLFKGVQARRAATAPEDRPYHGSPFGRGVFMAFMNFLTLPYFFAVSGWLLADGYLVSSAGSRVGFTLGATAGAAVIFGTYVRTADWIRRNAAYLTRNINFILGGLFVVLALVQGVRVYF